MEQGKFAEFLLFFDSPPRFSNKSLSRLYNKLQDSGTLDLRNSELAMSRHSHERLVTILEKVRRLRRY